MSKFFNGFFVGFIAGVFGVSALIAYDKNSALFMNGRIVPKGRKIRLDDEIVIKGFTGD